MWQTNVPRTSQVIGTLISYPSSISSINESFSRMETTSASEARRMSLIVSTSWARAINQMQSFLRLKRSSRNCRPLLIKSKFSLKSAMIWSVHLELEHSNNRNGLCHQIQSQLFSLRKWRLVVTFQIWRNWIVRCY